MIQTFFLIIAWIGIVISTIQIVMRLYADGAYSLDKVRQLNDRIHGIKRTWPLRYWPYVFLVSLAYLIAYYLN